MLVRWFAGAAHAAGIDEETLAPQQVPEGATVQAFLAGRHPDAAAVLARCSFLADGRSVGGEQPWPHQAEVLDVLPPFTGG